MDEAPRKNAARGSLTREELEGLVEDGLSIREMARRLERSPTTVRYWLQKHGLKTCSRRGGLRIHGKPGESRPTIVSVCAKHGRTEFSRWSGAYYRCRRCNSEAVMRWRRNTKLRLVKEAGGACVICGFDKMPAALQFHHLQPGAKSFGLSAHGRTKSIARLREEAAKCVLLCSNCHAGVEVGAIELPANLSAVKLKSAA